MSNVLKTLRSLWERNIFLTFHRNKTTIWIHRLGRRLLRPLELPLILTRHCRTNTEAISFFQYLWWSAFNYRPLKPDSAKAACSLLTHRRHFGNSCRVRAIQELGFIVVDVLNLDNKLRLGLHRLVAEPVQRLGAERVVGLLLPVQSLGSMNIPRVLINNENGTCPFAWQDVFDGTISFINIRVKLVKNSCEMRLTYKRVSDMEICKNNSYVRQQYMKFYCSWKDKLVFTVHSRKAIRMCQFALGSKIISFLPVNSLISKGIFYHSQS